MDPKLTEVAQTFARFKAAYARNDLDACVTLLSQLKVQLTKFPSLPPSFQQTPNAVEELKLASAVLDATFDALFIKEVEAKHELSSCEVGTVHNSVVDLRCCLRMENPLFLLPSFFPLGSPFCCCTSGTGLSSSTSMVSGSVAAVLLLVLGGDIYEHAVVLSVKLEDQDAFERDFCQLKPYYMDTCGIIPSSPEEYPILGLNLLRLLVQNRIAEFHTELELLPVKALEHPCINHAVELEQSFMEGAYNRVLSARQAVPHETYVYFMDLLAKTVRDEIAGCSEKGYDSLSISDAKHMLMFSSDQELQQYITEEHPEWEIKNGSVFFQKAKESQPCKEIPSLQLINQTLSYARELERIV
ncbi:hypothetical protein U9M48_040413 [Paspalum notatum var. saurae]|uniref:PCI domain-containing protein n=1 Tax=Paspalum notatum var. saurae TaxID=547442 RepID=A0AAQ3UR07_PASNO